MKRAFTLIEILIVISVIALLVAILLPTFASARNKARSAKCISNLRQLGQATMLYCHDFDEVFPLGGDASDVYTTGWIGTPWEAEMSNVRILPEVMSGYISDRELWHCPSDIGFDKTGQFETVVLEAHPSSFEKFSISYAYNSYLGAEQLQLSSVVAKEKTAPFTEHGVVDIALYGDPVGFWHGGRSRDQEHYNYVFCDGHAHSITRNDADRIWSVTYTRKDNISGHH